MTKEVATILIAISILLVSGNTRLFGKFTYKKKKTEFFTVNIDYFAVDEIETINEVAG